MAGEGDDTITREAELLRALCECEARERWGVIEQLARYRWQEADHQWIFEALSELRGSGAGGGREELARRLVRKGFPDIDLERIFARAPASGKVAEDLADELLARTAGRGGS